MHPYDLRLVRVRGEGVIIKERCSYCLILGGKGLPWFL